jgi:tetratricopeptide (TPR) repeat protein
VIAALHPNRLAKQVERLGHHALQGAVWDKAITYCRQAGMKAAVRSAYREAVASFEQALVALQHLPQSRRTGELAIDLHCDLRNVLLPLGEHGQTLDYLCKAKTLAETIGDDRRLAKVSGHMADLLRVMGAHDRAIEAGQQALTLALALRDRVLQVEANQRVAAVYCDLGEYRRAIEMLRQTVVSLGREQPVRERFGMTGLAAVTLREWLVWCLTEAGDFAEGITIGEAGVRIAEAINHPYYLMLVSYAIGYLYLRKGDLHQAISPLERSLGLCQAWTIQGFFPPIASTLAYAYALSACIAEALPLLEQVIEQMACMRSWRLSLLPVALSEAYFLVGHIEEAIQRAQHDLALAHERKERGTEAWTLRLLGDIAMHRDPLEAEQAANHYQQARAVAQELGMRPLQAHCHLGLGTLYAKIGRLEPACAELSTAIELYHAMDMTFWLPQAEAAMALLRGGMDK